MHINAMNFIMIDMGFRTTAALLSTILLSCSLASYNESRGSESMLVQLRLESIFVCLFLVRLFKLLRSQFYFNQNGFDHQDNSFPGNYYYEKEEAVFT